LYPQIYDFGNLLAAYKKARKGKRYLPRVAEFGQNLDRELLALYDELRDERYQPGGYTSFTIHEPKRRKISAAPFRDRVVHPAVSAPMFPCVLASVATPMAKLRG
jgi:hypothetical protein